MASIGRAQSQKFSKSVTPCTNPNPSPKPNPIPNPNPNPNPSLISMFEPFLFVALSVFCFENQFDFVCDPLFSLCFSTLSVFKGESGSSAGASAGWALLRRLATSSSNQPKTFEKKSSPIGFGKTRTTSGSSSQVVYSLSCVVLPCRASSCLVLSCLALFCGCLVLWLFVLWLSCLEVILS